MQLKTITAVRPHPDLGRFVRNVLRTETKKKLTIYSQYYKKMNTFLHTNRSDSKTNKRNSAVTVPTAGVSITEGEISLETANKNDEDEIVLNFDDEFIQNLNSLLLQSEISWQITKVFLYDLKVQEELRAMKVKNLKNNKKSYIDNFMNVGILFLNLNLLYLLLMLLL